jgi:tRNA(Ile)-lysidine synthase
MFRDFKQNLLQKIKLDPQKNVLLGFSAGPDSLCLLDLLHQNGFAVVAAHLDHGLRESSAEDAAHALDLCAELDVDCIVKKVDVAAHAALHHFTIEESARVLRYEFLFQEAERLNVQAVLVAHNADDQVETVLMHLMRGSGLSGLVGMREVLLPNPWSDSIPLVRPLIDITRAEIQAYLTERGQIPVLDETNADVQYFRNRIRHELIPYLETYNPTLRERMRRMADVAGFEDGYLQEKLEKNWKKALKQEGKHFLLFDRKVLLALHPAMLRRLLRRAIEWMDLSLRDINFEVINRAAGFFKQPTRSNRIDLLAGIELFLYRGDLVVARNNDPLLELWPQLQERGEKEIVVPGEMAVCPGWSLRSQKNTNTSLDFSEYIAYLDAKKLGNKLMIGRVQSGDRFTPFGDKAHTKKVGDFWTAEGLPARARRDWPLVRSGEEIVWIPGFRIADPYRVDETTTNVIQLELLKTNR